MPRAGAADDMTSGASPVAPAETPVPAAGDAALVVLSERYYQGLWKFSPTAATQVGVHTYDTKLDPVTPGAIQLEVTRLHSTLADLQKIDPAKLSLDGRTDQWLLEASIGNELFTLEERPDWQRRPAYYTDIVSGGVYTIMTRDFAPLSQRLQLVIAREKLIPAVLAQGMKNIRPSAVAPIVAAANGLDADGSVDFFSHDVPLAFAGVTDKALLRQFAASNAAAIAAVSRYAAFIHRTVTPAAHGSYAIGAAAYAELEKYQNATDIPVAQLLSVGEANLAKDKAAIIATSRAIDPNKTVQQVVASIQEDHPRSDQLLAVAQADLNTLVAFIKEKSIIDLPPAPIATVVKTPEFQAQTSFASMNAPGPLETKATEAYYNVTIVDPNWTPEQANQHLRFFNRPGLVIVGSHEAYPGHYTNYLFNKTHDLSLIRKIEWNNAFGEGWAHYDEQMMVDEGLGNGDPHYRVMQLMLALQRDCRYIVGIKEHTQGMSVASATTFFMDNAYMPKEPAYREAVRGTQDPLYGYYTLGKLMLLKLRADYQTKMGAAYSLRAFHDAVLSHGDPPIYYLRKFILGPDDTGSLL
jgi:uncharacterized protein (DUF885 family)